MAGSLSLSPGGRQGQEHSGKCSPAFSAHILPWQDENLGFSPHSSHLTKAGCPAGGGAAGPEDGERAGNLAATRHLCARGQEGTHGEPGQGLSSQGWAAHRVPWQRVPGAVSVPPGWELWPWDGCFARSPLPCPSAHRCSPPPRDGNGEAGGAAWWGLHPAGLCWVLPGCGLHPHTPGRSRTPSEPQHLSSTIDRRRGPCEPRC